jgi:microcystin degradation protein MlrC
VSDGQFTFTGPMYGGAHANLGSMAALKVLDRDCDVTVVVGSNRTQNADQAIFTHMGIDPTQQAIVVVKSAVHFLADYEPIAETVIFAESPGANPCQLDRIPFTRLRKGVRLGPNGPAFDQTA